METVTQFSGHSNVPRLLPLNSICLLAEYVKKSFVGKVKMKPDTFRF